MRVYLDHNATTPLRDEARAAMISAMDVVGNPSSVHAEGRAAKGIVERARAQVAALVGCLPQQVVFTSGATEAANTVVAQGWDLVAVSSNAHDCFVSSIYPHSEVNLRTHVIPARVCGWGDGGLPLMTERATKRRTLYVVSEGCGETGLMFDVGAIQEFATEKEAAANEVRVGDPAHRILLVNDISQAAGKACLSGARKGYAVCSAHKLGGPKGVGALINFTAEDPVPLQRGGGQEMGRRSGTENVIGIAGFGAAAEAAARDLASGAWARVEKLRDQMEAALEDASADTSFVCKAEPRLPNTSCILTPEWKGETQVMQMDLAGFAVSAGSACSSGKVKASRVLQDMGYSDTDAASAIRVSLGLDTTEDEVMRFVKAWSAALDKHKARAA